MWTQEGTKNKNSSLYNRYSDWHCACTLGLLTSANTCRSGVLRNPEAEIKKVSSVCVLVTSVETCQIRSLYSAKSLSYLTRWKLIESSTAENCRARSGVGRARSGMGHTLWQSGHIIFQLILHLPNTLFHFSLSKLITALSWSLTSRKQKAQDPSTIFWTLAR